MNHPVLVKYKHLIWYLLVWGIFGTIQTSVLRNFYGLSTPEALTDSLVYNLLFAIIGLALWYPVRYSNFEKAGNFYVLFNQLATAAFTILFWFFTGRYLVSSMGFTGERYKMFMQNAVPWRIMVGVFFYLLITVSYYLIVYYRNFKEKITREAELKSLIREAELSLLRSQLKPHFLFNSLNSISSLTITNPDRAREMVIRLSEFLRYSLKIEEKQTIPLKDELENIKHYLEIEKSRFGEKLNYQIKLNEGCELMTIPGMILQPLFENAVKHGVYESTEQIIIRTECIKNDGFLDITIVNNFDPEAVPPKGTGTGLRNVKDRLALIYHRGDLIQTNREENQFRVFLRIPQI